LWKQFSIVNQNCFKSILKSLFLSKCYYLLIISEKIFCTLETNISRVEISIPKSSNYPYYDRCHRKDLDSFAILNHRKDIRSMEWKANNTVACSQWEYNFTQIPYASIAAEVKYPWMRLYKNIKHMENMERKSKFANTLRQINRAINWDYNTIFPVISIIIRYRIHE